MIKLFSFVLVGLLHFSAYAGFGAYIPEASCSETEKESALQVVLNSNIESLGSFEYDFSIFVLFECNETKHGEVELSWMSEWSVREKKVRKRSAGGKRYRTTRKAEFIYPPAYMMISVRNGSYILEDFGIEISFESNRVVNVKEI